MMGTQKMESSEQGQKKQGDNKQNDKRQAVMTGRA